MRALATLLSLDTLHALNMLDWYMLDRYILYRAMVVALFVVNLRLFLDDVVRVALVDIVTIVMMTMMIRTGSTPAILDIVVMVV